MKTFISDMLNNYDKSHPIRLHMPGHKGKGEDFYGRDITELTFSDNLRTPSGVIQQSQRAYAQELNVKFCHYLVNGSTVGLFAFAYSSAGKVLTEEKCHVSLKNALELADKQVVYMPAKDNEGIPQPPTVADIAQYVEQDGSIGTVIITSPNYYGKCADLKAIYKYCRSKKLLLFVDSAHGAHFGLSKLLPYNACEFCDAAVESTHKTLGALTQTAVLLTDDAKLSAELKQYINIFTTTSPNYLLIESIEKAMVRACDAKKDYQALYNEVVRFKNNCRELGWTFVNNDDFTRLVLDCKPHNETGTAVYNALQRQGVYCEYADSRYVIAIVTLYDNGLSLDAFYTALKDMVVTSESYEPMYADACFGDADKIISN